MKFKFDVLENGIDGIEKVKEKMLYSIEEGQLNIKQWLNEGKSKLMRVQAPVVSSALNIAKDITRGYCVKDMMGDMYYDSLSINKNQQSVAFFSTAFSNASNVLVLKSNLMPCMAGFAARRLIESDVWNSKDEYMKPSDEVLNSQEYKQWNLDCLVYSLFENQSFQSSLRQVDYQGKKWNIENQFFWASQQQMFDLAEKHNVIPVLDDIEENGGTRYMHTLLKDNYESLSEDAKKVLEYANHLLDITMPVRARLCITNPEYHLNAWDAGWAQIKLLTKQYFPSEHKHFRGHFDEFANRLRPYVYKFGFLYE